MGCEYFLCFLEGVVLCGGCMRSDPSTQPCVVVVDRWITFAIYAVQLGTFIYLDSIFVQSTRKWSYSR
jgi:hypothetical protein